MADKETRQRVVWEPQERQRVFLSRPEYEVLYGGAAGGGKSDAMLIEALRQVNIPHYKGIIFRKTYKQLEELIDRSRTLYGAAFPRARYNSTAHCWRFPSGAKIYFGNMQRVADRTNYQGKAYDFIGFDELTHFTWDEYSYMFSRNRPTGAGTRVYIRATANPGGIGHGWVKERFITAAPAGKTVWELADIHMPDGSVNKMMRSRAFIPSTVFDNQALLDNDPQYLASLAMLPDAERQALLYGNWDSFSGQVFTEWRNDPDHYGDRLWTHVIDPFPIPRHWRVWRSFDFGYAKPFSVGWYTADEQGKIYRIKEYYGCTGTPNVGLRMDPAAIAREIKKAEQDDPELKGRVITGIADPAIFDRQRGESVADLMGKEGIFWIPGDHTRLAGKMQLHYRLAFDAKGIPGMQVFSTCRNFIRTIPALVYDDAHVEDINTDMEDHIYDECRYLLMEHPISPRENVKKQSPQFDPLDQFGGDKAVFLHI